MIRALIFDLGRVLLNLDPEASYARMSALSGLSSDEIRSLFRGSRLSHDFESGRIPARDFARRVCELLGTDVPYEDFREAWYAMVDQGAIVPEEFIVALRRKYRLVLLSNTNELHFEMLRARCSMLNHFDGYTLSYQVGAQKPDKAIYLDAIEKSRCEPQECFYTDDIEEYVQAARRMGINAAQFPGFEELKTILRDAGVDC